MMRSISLTKLFWGALLLAGSASPASAQWDLWDPWLSGPSYQTTYYGPRPFYGGYWGANYAPAVNSAYYGPAPAWGCGCQPACDQCGSCGSGGCASGNCSMNAAPPGSPRPIAEPNGTGSYGKDAPVPGRGSTGGNNKTFDESDPGQYERPKVNEAPRRPYPPNKGTGNDVNLPADDFNRRSSGGTGTAGDADFPGDPNALPNRTRANRPELVDPDIPMIPEKAPAGPVNVEEEAPKDADLGLEGKMTNRPVLLRDRFVARSRSSAPTAARTPVRPTRDWSATPVTARVARQ